MNDKPVSSSVYLILALQHLQYNPEDKRSMIELADYYRQKAEGDQKRSVPARMVHSVTVDDPVDTLGWLLAGAQANLVILKALRNSRK